jgi:hypothetical protein
MTRTYALLRLLELGPLERKEIRQITEWSEKNLKYVLAGAARNGTVECLDGKWHRRFEDGVLQKDTL